MPFKTKEAQTEYFHQYYLKHQEKIKEQSRQRKLRRRENHMCVSARRRAALAGLDFNLTEDDIQIPTHCPILKTELNLNNQAPHRATSPSLDRIDNTKGYIKGNVQVISYLANTMKSNATPQELLLFAEWIFSTYKKET